jgi:hypothetical protein
LGGRKLGLELLGCGDGDSAMTVRRPSVNPLDSRRVDGRTFPRNLTYCMSRSEGDADADNFR